MCSARTRLLAVLLLTCAVARAEEPVRVFAAASLTDALGEVAALWQANGHPRPVLAFGGSSTLAKQIEAGAPADLYASADRAWMDYLDSKQLLESTSRVDLLGNDLVLIAPAGRSFHVEMKRGFAIATAFAGKLCTGEPETVPVGRYGKAALESLGWWDSVAGRIVGTEDVRTALAFVEHGECAAGIVYATDVASGARVEVVAQFPAGTHAPIVYPFALVRGSRPEARGFLNYLRESPIAAEVFQQHGFALLPAGR